MGWVLPRNVTNREANLPIEVYQAFSVQIKLSVVAQLLWVHEADDRLDTGRFHAVSPPEGPQH